jgi:hypothetical protein
MDLHLGDSGLVEDRLHTLGFGEREEGPFHEVALVAGGTSPASASNGSSVARSPVLSP